MMEIAHRTARLPGVDMHYGRVGQGEPVVLLHGWPQTWYQWRHVIPLLSGEYELIIPDLRGLGDTSCPNSGYEKKTLAEDIRHLLEGELGFSSFHVVGHSWGGCVGYSLAGFHPELVRSLTMIGVTPGRLGREFNGWWHLFHQLPDLPERLITGREETYFDWFYVNFAHEGFVLPADVKCEYLRTYSQPEHVKAALSYYRAIPQDNVDNSFLAEHAVSIVRTFGAARGVN